MPGSAYFESLTKIFWLCFWLNREILNSSVVLALITGRKKTVRTWNIVQGKTQFSGHRFMSGIYNVGYCAMTWCDFWNGAALKYSFFNRYSTTINLVKEKQNGSITKGHKRGVLGTPHLVKNTARSPPLFFKIRSPGIMFKIERASTSRSY